jgi:DNA (cytosine-5)-methyltransferase 1
MGKFEPKQLKFVDFFCGAGGMTYGLRRAGMRVLAGIDNDSSVRDTYTRNNSPGIFLNEDVTKLTEKKLAKVTSIRRNDDSLVFAGCSPCQFWSKIKTDKNKSAKSAHLLMEFLRFVRWFRPGYVIIENVPGLLTNKASILPKFQTELKDLGYLYEEAVLNAVEYGVPQNRRRYLMIATRLPWPITLPPGRQDPKLIVRHFLGPKNGFPRIPDGHTDSTVRIHTAAALSETNRERIRRTPADGGTRASWRNDRELQLKAYKGKDDIFSDVYGRMYWNRPAPTITTRFISFSNGRFGHPEEDRAISLREGATLQTFPKQYVFHGIGMGDIARQIGNAVPPMLAQAIGKTLISHHKQVPKSKT